MSFSGRESRSNSRKLSFSPYEENNSFSPSFKQQFSNVNQSIKKLVSWEPDDSPIAHLDDPNLGEPTVYDPEKPPQREIILTAHEGVIDACREDESYSLRKWILFSTCFFCNIIGVVLTLYSRALTLFFDQYKPNQTMLIISCVFYLPCLIWFCYICFPYQKERKRRNLIRAHRRFRQRLKQRQYDYFHGRDIEKQQEEKEKQEAIEREEKSKRRYMKTISFKDDGLSGKKSSFSQKQGLMKGGSTKIAPEALDTSQKALSSKSLASPAAPPLSSKKVSFRPAPSPNKRSVQFAESAKGGGSSRR